MVVAIETVILCIFFFLICFGGTGTDDKRMYLSAALGVISCTDKLPIMGLI